MENLFGLTVEEIGTRFASLGLPKYRQKQIAEWMYQKSAVSFEVMTNLPKNLRGDLGNAFSIDRAKCVEQWDASDGRTSKFLLEFSDGVAIETVLMRQPYGNSVCISTQAGCAMGCAFCASTVHGVERNLTAGEMLDEVLVGEERLRDENEKVDTMVLMGSGEPLKNYDNVLTFLRLIHEPYCLNMGYRNIAVSTSGIVPGIERLAEEGIPVTLSISLHAPSDTLRSMLMPINRKYGVDKVVAAGRDYALKTKRRVTYEYILIRGVNDGEKEAQSLAELLRGQLANVNLIPINPVTERNWERPPEENIQRFCRVLERLHIVATVRQEMGSDIQAACGQLRNRRMEKGDFD
ncbi:MAG: 23S rRNA (adenine(2503)-C(2))-methyltransferase RlmN [Schwartzia sp.]|nr:23S rRNA (adenine(2503)-C(2))-methyltransferase RlmN [Schwartzia sp. (in: firmicutes)]